MYWICPAIFSSAPKQHTEKIPAATFYQQKLYSNQSTKAEIKLECEKKNLQGMEKTMSIPLRAVVKTFKKRREVLDKREQARECISVCEMILDLLYQSNPSMYKDLGIDRLEGFFC